MSMRSSLAVLTAALVVSISSARAENHEKARFMEASAVRYEMKGDLEAAMRRARIAIKEDKTSPEPYLLGSRIRLKMNDTDRSEGNLYYAVLRARRAGGYRALSDKVRNDSDYSSILDYDRNRLILDLFDEVEAGTMTVEEAKERLRTEPSMRDALNPIPAPEPVEAEAAAPVAEPLQAAEAETTAEPVVETAAFAAEAAPAAPETADTVHGPRRPQHLR
jgi:hypothetical protein